MRILIVPDSFKENLTALEVAQVVQSDFQEVSVQAEYDLLPISDRGEGTTSSPVDSLRLKRQTAVVTSAFGKSKEIQYALDGQTAIFEMVEIAELRDAPLSQRQPFRLSTWGVGELIRQLLQQGVRYVIIGIGESSTNDGGIDMAEGLGYTLYDQNNQRVEAPGENLGGIATADKTNILIELVKAKITVITSVTNFLCGKEGASFAFGSQKDLEENKLTVADQAMHDLYMGSAPQVIEASSSSAGGGMGVRLLAFASGKVISGIDYVLDLLELDKRVQQVDLVIVGEGRLDGQSLRRKVPVGIARRVPEGVSVIAICGSAGKGSEKVADVDISAAFPILPAAVLLQEALQQATNNLHRTAENITSLLRTIHFQGDNQ